MMHGPINIRKKTMSETKPASRLCPVQARSFFHSLEYRVVGLISEHVTYHCVPNLNFHV